MSIVNGTLDRRRQLLDAWNLDDNPFIKTEPPESVIDRVFVGREKEMRAAAMRVVDRPRNVLVYGGYGCGKTTFVRKLLRELTSAKRVRFLTGYAPLGHDSPQGFQLAALAAFCEGARQATTEGPLHDFAREALDELGRLPPGTTEIGSVDLRFRKGLGLAKAAGFHRVVLVVDEIDKRDARVVQEVLIGSRFLLDLEASFVLTGRYLDVFADIRSSLLAAFDHRVELPPFEAPELRLILQRNLAIARRQPEPQETLRPFEDDTAAQMVEKARGLPRPLNLMACATLNEALDEGAEGDVPPPAVTLAHLERALLREGNIIYNEVGADARALLAALFRRKGYASGADLDALVPDGVPEAVRELDTLSREDAVLRLEATDGAAFVLSPPIEQNLRVQTAQRDQLRALWSGALTAADKDARGRALEAFAAAFFEEQFKIIARNLRTDTEELDLVLERMGATEPRFGKATYLIVECKNWRTRAVDQTAVTKLFGELSLHHAKQGFLVATGSISDEARQQARYAATQDVEIILIDGPAIEKFLDGLAPVSDLLVELHRSQILRAT